MNERRFSVGLRIGLLLLLLAGCAGADIPGQPGSFLATADPAPVTGAVAGSGEYKLSVGDILSISVFQVSDLTRDVQVDSSGKITLPLIGDVKAAGETERSLAAELTSKLKAKYLQNPQVSVFIKTAAGRQITVTGAVNRPGVFPIVGRTTLVQVLAAAGDINAIGDSSAILVFRQVNGTQMAAKFNVDDIRAGKAADPDLSAGDMVVVDTSGPRSAWQNVKDVLPVAGWATSVAASAGAL